MNLVPTGSKFRAKIHTQDAFGNTVYSHINLLWSNRKCQLRNCGEFKWQVTNSLLLLYTLTQLDAMKFIDWCYRISVTCLLHSHYINVVDSVCINPCNLVPPGGIQIKMNKVRHCMQGRENLSVREATLGSEESSQAHESGKPKVMSRWPSAIETPTLGCAKISSHEGAFVCEHLMCVLFLCLICEGDCWEKEPVDCRAVRTLEDNLACKAFVWETVHPWAST